MTDAGGRDGNYHTNAAAAQPGMTGG